MVMIVIAGKILRRGEPAWCLSQVETPLGPACWGGNISPLVALHTVPSMKEVQKRVWHSTYELVCPGFQAHRDRATIPLGIPWGWDRSVCSSFNPQPRGPMESKTCSCPSYVHSGYARATTIILCVTTVVLGAMNIVQSFIIIITLWP